MKKLSEKFGKKAVRNFGLFAFFITGVLLASGLFVQIGDDMLNKNDLLSSGDAAVDNSGDVVVDVGSDGTWHKTMTVNSWELDALAENDPGAGSTGWLSTFVLDYGADPDTVLANNATDWSAEATARGYVDSDSATTDLKAEDPGYFVVRCRFTTTTQEDGSWNYSRIRVNLTTWGDETISDVGEYDNSSTDGDAVISTDEADWLFVNFYWDDGSDGYQITKDGTINWQLTVYEKY